MDGKKQLAASKLQLANRERWRHSSRASPELPYPQLSVSRAGARLRDGAVHYLYAIIRAIGGTPLLE